MKARLLAAQSLGAAAALSLALWAAGWFFSAGPPAPQDAADQAWPHLALHGERPNARALPTPPDETAPREWSAAAADRTWLPPLTNEARTLLVSFAGEETAVEIPTAAGPALVPAGPNGLSAPASTDGIAPFEQSPGESLQETTSAVQTPDNLLNAAAEQLEDTLDGPPIAGTQETASDVDLAAEDLQAALDASRPADRPPATPPAPAAGETAPLWSMDVPPHLPPFPSMPGTADKSTDQSTDQPTGAGEDPVDELQPVILPPPPAFLPPVKADEPSYDVDPVAPTPVDQAPALIEEPALLPPPNAVRIRSRELELLAREADLHTRRAFELASRKAYFSARAEFITALRLVAQGLDNEYQTDRHSRALAAGLTALDEAGDFLPRGGQLEANLDMATIASGHRTPVLRENAGRVSPMVAMGVYFTFAQEQLSLAAGNEVAASMALYGLARLHSVLGDESTAVPAAKPKAMALCQAAILAAPANYLASNELGVLLAQGGRYDEARLAIEHSLTINSMSPTAWHNLGVVYEHLGESGRAQRARALAQQGGSTKTPALAGPVRWLPPHTFAGLPAGKSEMAASPGGAAPHRK